MVLLGAQELTFRFKDVRFMRTSFILIESHIKIWDPPQRSIDFTDQTFYDEYVDKLGLHASYMLEGSCPVFMNLKLHSPGATDLVSQAYAYIKHKIVINELKSGDALSISALSKELGISRTPITAACQRLEYDGFVNIVPKQGVVVRFLTVNEARDITELRAAIETYSAKRVFNVIDEEDIANLEEGFIRMDKSRDNLYQFMLEDTGMHKYLLGKGSNGQFLSIVDNLYDLSVLIGLMTGQDPARLDDILQEHRNIIDALIDKDRDRFVRSLDINIMNGFISLSGQYIRDVGTLV